jgi:hypothetical protein
LRAAQQTGLARQTPTGATQADAQAGLARQTPTEAAQDAPSGNSAGERSDETVGQESDSPEVRQ